MNRARARGGEAHADFAGEFGVRASHECSHLFMTRLHEGDLPLAAHERAHDAVDTVAGIAVAAAHTPLPQTVQEKVGGGVAHTKPPCFSCATPVITVLAAHFEPMGGCNRYATDEPLRGILPTRLARQRLMRIVRLICRSLTPGAACSSKKLVVTCYDAL